MQDEPLRRSRRAAPARLARALTTLTRARTAAAGAIAVALLAWGTAAARAAPAAQAPEPPAPMAPPTGTVVSEEIARQALSRAMEYAQFHYQLGGEERVGVPYRLGGKVTLEAFAALVQSDPQAAQQAGVDASGLVINAFRAVIPGIEFFTGPRGDEGLARTVSSSALYRWNSLPVRVDEVRPGDLLFFKSPTTGEITGVALVSERRGDVVRVVVASASRGHVVEIGLLTTGEYWRTRVAGLGRLVYAGGAAPAQTP